MLARFHPGVGSTSLTQRERAVHGRSQLAQRDKRPGILTDIPGQQSLELGRAGPQRRSGKRITPGHHHGHVHLSLRAALNGDGDVPAILGASDLFCLSSLAEGLPYALLEAIAHRLPLLVTAVDGMAELLTDQETACLVPPANPQALADGLVWLADHPEARERLATAVYQLVQARFDPARMIRETLAIYEKR